MSFASCCCVVKNIPKRVYVLPRRYKRNRSSKEPGQAPEPVTHEMVIQELATIFSRLKITKYTTKIVKKNFAFDKKFANKEDAEDIPYESEYIQVEYHVDSNHNSNNSNAGSGGGGGRNMLADLSGETFVCMFGANSSYTEHLLINLKIKGFSKLTKSFFLNLLNHQK